MKAICAVTPNGVGPQSYAGLREHYCTREYSNKFFAFASLCQHHQASERAYGAMSTAQSHYMALLAPVHTFSTSRVRISNAKHANRQVLGKMPGAHGARYTRRA